MRFLAVLKDSFRETLDCKTFWILFVVSSVLVLLSFSVSFEALSPEEALGDIAGGFDTLVRGRSRRKHDVVFSVDEATEDGKGGYRFRLRARPAAAYHALVRHWDGLVRGEIKRLDDPVPDATAPPDPDLERQYLEARFRMQQLLKASVEPEAADGDALAWRVGVRPERPELLRGAHRVGALFGLFSVRPRWSAAYTIGFLERFLADGLAGLAGLLFAVVVTGSFVPEMLQKGRIDLLLSRPVGRATLLLSKYGGGLLYVLINAAYLVGGCWLGLSLRTGTWNPAFLLTIPVLTFVFAVLYAFSVWIGVLTRSALVAILTTIALWFCSSSAGSFDVMARLPATQANVPPTFEKVAGIAHKLLPKTYDLKELNNSVILRARLGDEVADTLLEAKLVDPSTWPFLVSSTLAALATFLAAACATFSRRDY